MGRSVRPSPASKDNDVRSNDHPSQAHGTGGIEAKTAVLNTRKKCLEDDLRDARNWCGVSVGKYSTEGTSRWQQAILNTARG